MAVLFKTGATEQLYTVKDIARSAKVSIKTVRRWIDNDGLKIHRLGAQIRVSHEDWAAFLAERKQS